MWVRVWCGVCLGQRFELARKPILLPEHITLHPLLHRPVSFHIAFPQTNPNQTHEAVLPHTETLSLKATTQAKAQLAHLRSVKTAHAAQQCTRCDQAAQARVAAKSQIDHLRTVKPKHHAQQSTLRDQAAQARVAAKLQIDHLRTVKPKHHAQQSTLRDQAAQARALQRQRQRRAASRKQILRLKASTNARRKAAEGNQDKVINLLDLERELEQTRLLNARAGAVVVAAACGTELLYVRLKIAKGDLGWQRKLAAARAAHAQALALAASLRNPTASETSSAHARTAMLSKGDGELLDKRARYLNARITSEAATAEALLEERASYNRVCVRIRAHLHLHAKTRGTTTPHVHRSSPESRATPHRSTTASPVSPPRLCRTRGKQHLRDRTAQHKGGLGSGNRALRTLKHSNTDVHRLRLV